MQVADNGSAAELDDGSVRAGDVCADQSHQMLACRVSIPILICVYSSLLDTNYELFEMFAIKRTCHRNRSSLRRVRCACSYQSLFIKHCDRSISFMLKILVLQYSLVVVMFEYAFCSRKTLYPVNHKPNRLCVIA